MYRFKEVEEWLSEPARLNTSLNMKNVPNVDADLQNDLYRFAGLNCANVQRNEVTFNFASHEQQDKSKYAVQLFFKDGKAHLGKWVMPMSINMNQILNDNPIDNVKNVTPFVRTCKHYIDCYTERQRQFLLLKQHVSNMHCDLQSNTGYTKISLELYGVHDHENDKYINIIIYLQYHSNRTRPHKIEVEPRGHKNTLSDDVKQKLKACLKEFKLSDLSTAFDKVLANDSEFTWIKADDSDSPLELHYSSDSDEQGFLEQLQSERRKSLRQAKRKRELKKKWNERKRQKYVASKIATSGDDDSEAGELRTEREISRNRKTSKEASKDNTSKTKSNTGNPKTRLRIRNKEKEVSKDDSEANLPLTKNPTKEREISRRWKAVEETSKDNDSEANESHTENPPKNLRRKKRKETSKDDSETSSPIVRDPIKSLRKKKNVASIPKEQQNIDKNLEDGTPKIRNKLKQTKLNFQVNSVKSPASTENSVFSPNLSNKPDNKKNKVVTSTPMSRRRTSRMAYLETINITEIERPNKSTNSMSRVLRNSAQKNKTLRKSSRLSKNTS